MPSAIVAGGGLAGLAAAAALGDAGFSVDIIEMRPYPGGRATSYSVTHGDGWSGVLDNCQHILLRCCTNLLDFYRRLGVSGQLTFHQEFFWVEPGGRVSKFKPGLLPVPAHFTEAFLKLRFLSPGEKVSVATAMLAAQSERRSLEMLDAISMEEWLRERSQSPRAIERFWRQVLVSAVNEELDSMSAWHGLQVIRLGFLATRSSSEMGVPEVTLAELYEPQYWHRLPNVRFRFRSAVSRLNGVCELASGERLHADYYIVALPFDRTAKVLTELPEPQLEHSPITGVHLWFDRCVTELPHATLLDRTIQWMFNKGAGRHLQLVISASRGFIPKARAEIIELCRREIAEFFPAARDAALLRAHVVKEVGATISARPGVASRRPGPLTSRPNIFLAGDWTRTGWPSTMEGAVRSGYAAAEAVTAAAGMPHRFLAPEITEG